MNQRKRENGRRNVFMTKSPRKNVPDVGIELGAACMPSELASDRATAPGSKNFGETASTNSVCLPPLYRRTSHYFTCVRFENSASRANDSHFDVTELQLPVETFIHSDFLS